MEREFEMRFYDMNGEVGIVLVNMWDGTAYTNIESATKRENSTHVSVNCEEVGTEHFDDLARNELVTLTHLFNLKNMES